MKTKKSIGQTTLKASVAAFMAVCAGSWPVHPTTIPQPGFYFSSRIDHRINRIDLNGSIDLFASGLPDPIGVTFDNVGNLYVANYFDNSISRVAADGTVSTFIQGNGLSGPLALAFDLAGNLYVANGNGDSISKISRSTSTISTFASGLSAPRGLAFDSQGNLYVANFSGTISRVTPDGVASPFASGLNGPLGLAFDTSGFLYVANYLDHSISRIALDGVVSAFATLPTASTGYSFASDGDGNLLVPVGILLGGSIAKVAPSGAVSTFSTAYDPYGIASAPTLANSPSPSAPIANAGQSQVVSANGMCQATVTLDGTGSTNPNHYLLAYIWTHPSFGTAYGPMPTVVLPLGMNVIDLTVSDGLGGSSSASVAVNVAANSPSLTSTSPSITSANGPDFNLTLNGCGFVNGSTVRWNGAARPTTFVSDSQLTAVITAQDLASSAALLAVNVTVANPDDSISSPISFAIYGPTVSAVQTGTVGPGQAAIYLSDNNQHGFTGYVNNQGSTSLAMTLAIYSQNPTARSFPDVGAGTLNFLGLQLAGASASDSANVVFDFPVDFLTVYPGTPGFTLLYFNGMFWAPVLSSGGVPPALVYDQSGFYPDGNASGNFIVLFDHTSTPKITDLGNVFVFGFGIYPNLNYQNFANGAVGLGGSGGALWFDNFQVGAPGAPPQLISTLDYSDTFTITPVRTDGLYHDNSNGAYDVENSHGNPSATWTEIPGGFGIFSFNTPGSSTHPATVSAASGNAGANTGLGQATDNDFNFSYGVRSDYIVQVDAILPIDRFDDNRVEISSLAAAGSSPSAAIGGGSANSLTVFFWRDSSLGAGITVYNGTWETKLYDASGGLIRTGVDDSDWHNYAVEFNQADNVLKIYVDRLLKATVNLATFALPTITCPDPIVVTAAPGSNSATVNFNLPGSGPDVLVVCSPPSGSTFPVGTTTVNCTATDPFGNLSTCSFDVTVDPPPPTLDSLSPNTMAANSAGFTLTLHGTDFVNSSAVLWNGAPRPTDFISSSQITAEIPSSDLDGITELTSVLVKVQNPDGSQSAAHSFAITPANVSAVQTTAAEPGQTATVSTAPSSAGSAGVSAIVNNTGGDPVAVTVANYSSNPSGTAFSAGGGFTDVQIVGADSADTASANFYYPSTIDPATEVALILVWFNGSEWAAVRSNGNSDPVKNTSNNLDGTISGGRFTVIFSSTSTPQITELSGTFFAAGIPDSIPPTLSCPDVAVPCSLDLLVPVNYPAPAVSDNLDPAPTVTYSIPSGSGFPVGMTVVTCTATDASGNAQSTTFTVTRASLGFTGFLSPIGGADGSGGSATSPIKTYKAGSTIPIKFTASCGGEPVTSGIHRLEVVQQTSITTAGTPIDATPQDAATTGSQFRLTNGQWHFNLDTKTTGMNVGIWQLIATLSDGSNHRVWIQLK